MAFHNRVPKKQFAEMAGVTAGAITRQFPESHPAVHLRKIDLDHSEVRAYLQKKDAKKNQPPKPPKKPTAPKSDENTAVEMPLEVPKQEFPEELYAMTLKEIVDTYGHIASFSNHVKALKELESYRSKQQKNEKDRGELVDKKVEGNLIFEVLEGLFKRLVDDIPQTVTRRVIAIAKKGDDDAELLIQREYQDATSRALKVCQTEILERLGENEREQLGA